MILPHMVDQEYDILEVVSSYVFVWSVFNFFVSLASISESRVPFIGLPTYRLSVLNR